MDAFDKLRQETHQEAVDAGLGDLQLGERVKTAVGVNKTVIGQVVEPLDETGHTVGLELEAGYIVPDDQLGRNGCLHLTAGRQYEVIS